MLLHRQGLLRFRAHGFLFSEYEFEQRALQLALPSLPGGGDAGLSGNPLLQLCDAQRPLPAECEPRYPKFLPGRHGHAPSVNRAQSQASRPRVL